MAKIRGKFAPLTEELGNDERFIIECSDFEKLMYMLIIYTTHMTRHAAPVDPSYYQRRYGLRTRHVRIRAAIDTLLVRFPNLKCTDGKLSLLNSATYESQILPKESLEVESEVESEVEVKSESKSDFKFSEDQERLIFDAIADARGWSRFAEATHVAFRELMERVRKNKPDRPFAYALKSAQNEGKPIPKIAVQKPEEYSP